MARAKRRERKKAVRADTAEARQRAASVYLETISEKRPAGNYAAAARVLGITAATLKRWSKLDWFKLQVKELQKQVREAEAQDVAEGGDDDAINRIRRTIRLLALRAQTGAENIAVADIPQAINNLATSLNKLAGDPETYVERLAMLPREVLLRELELADLELEEASTFGDAQKARLRHTEALEGIDLEALEEEANEYRD